MAPGGNGLLAVVLVVQRQRKPGRFQQAQFEQAQGRLRRVGRVACAGFLRLPSREVLRNVDLASLSNFDGSGVATAPGFSRVTGADLSGLTYGGAPLM